MSSNALFQTTTVALVLLHGGILMAARHSSGGVKALLLLNALISLVVVLYGSTRLRHLLGAADGLYLAWLVFEFAVLVGAIAGLWNNRPATVWSYVGFGFHGCLSIAAAVFAFAFKMNRLM